MLVFANKTDVNGCMDEVEIQQVRARHVVGEKMSGVHANRTRMQGLQLNAIRTHKWHIIRCSAITGENLKDGLAWVVQDAKARLFLY